MFKDNGERLDSMTPYFSIITVVLNNAETILDTMRSVASQSHADYEHWVIDGLSQDDTTALVKAHGDGRTRLVCEPDHGIYDAMNKGIARSGGAVIGFLNADDVYATNDVLATVAEVFCDPKVEACYGDLCYVRRCDLSSIVRYWRSSSFRPGAFARGWCPPHPTFFVRRRIYEQYGTFDPVYSLAADFELMLRFLDVHRVRSRYIPRVLVKMRLGGVTNRRIANLVAQNRQILKALKRHGLPASMLRLAVSKCGSRGLQFIQRPKPEKRR